MVRRAIPEWPYEIDDSGNVYRVGSDTPLRPAEAKRGGYLQVSLWRANNGKTYFVHQLVALAFHGPRPSPRHHAAHRDGDKRNNAQRNVQWITKKENEADKVTHGTANRGERNGGAKLTAAQVSEIRERAQLLPRSSGGCRILKGALGRLASEYGVSRDCLYQLITNRRWQESA